MKKGLGKGLDALFEDNSFDIETNSVTEAKIINVEPDRNQPRRDFDEEALNELADSIREHGIISPIIVSRIGEDRYRIIAGERRYRAAKLAGLETVPIVVRDYTPEQLAEISLVENLQREDLNPLEEALGYKSLMEQYGLSQEQVSQKVSKSRPAVANALRLLNLPEQVLDFIRTGELSAGHARTLLGLDNTDEVIAVAEKVIAEDMSVRKTEELIKKMKTGAKQVVMRDPEVEIAIRQLEEKAAAGTGNKVRIKHGTTNRGKIEIFYNSTDELEKLIEMLS